MRFKKYLKEEKEKNPTTKKFGFFQDNPGGSWLKHEREVAKRSKLGGSVTGGFKEFIQIPTKMLSGLRGMQGENRKLTDPDVKKLLKAIEVEGIYNPVFINVQYDGEPMINEGNRRALVAKTLGFEYVPIELRYYSGGELIDGPFHPDKIAKVAKSWKKPPKPPSIKKAEEEMKKWREEQKKNREKEKIIKKEKPKEPENIPDDIKDILKQLGFK